MRDPVRRLKAITRILGALLLLGVGVVGVLVGDRIARKEIAGAIRTGRLSLEQRVDSVGSQIETGRYHPVGR